MCWHPTVVVVGAEFPFIGDVCLMCGTTVPPPLVPKANGQDDTSNFEPPEPSNRPALPAVHHGNRTSGFSGKELPFIGFTFTRALGSCPGGEQMEPVKGSVVRWVGTGCHGNMIDMR